MFTKIRLWLARAWQFLVNPEVPLKADFPWSFGTMAKQYGVSMFLFAVGALVPFGALMAGIYFIEKTDQKIMAITLTTRL